MIVYLIKVTGYLGETRQVIGREGVLGTFDDSKNNKGIETKKSLTVFQP